MLERIKTEFFDVRAGEWPKALGLSVYFSSWSRFSGS